MLTAILVIAAGGFAVATFYYKRKIDVISQTHADDLAEVRRRAQESLDDKLAELSALYQHESNALTAEHAKAAAELAEVNLALTKASFEQDTASQLETPKDIESALSKAEQLASEAAALCEDAKKTAADAKRQATATLLEAKKIATDITKGAELRAEETSQGAFRILSEYNRTQLALTAARDTLEGYGNRYVVPTHSLLDDLAQRYGFSDIGASLARARELTRQMVKSGLAAECDYVEPERRGTAIRFVIDAFNGRVDSILSDVTIDNHGTLAQQIKNAFALVNHNGSAFRNARILPDYLAARIEELRLAVGIQKLREKEREEQREMRERMREEERAKKEAEAAQREAERKEREIRERLARAQEEADRAAREHASTQAVDKLNQELAGLKQRLIEAEANKQRALSMAQQTRRGTVYIISNIGSFGEGVVKIGMTRRLEPMDRIWELSDASVPFDFDVHALIPSDDAPALESLLHRKFAPNRVNKVNEKKEFFRIPLASVRETLLSSGHNAEFTMTAKAQEYRETQGLPLDYAPKDASEHNEASEKN